MPQFGRLGELHTVAYITGPRHLWLGLKFAPQTIAEPVVVMRPPIGTCDHGSIDPEKLVRAVVAGAAEFGMHPAHIEYVENDSPAYNLYAHCARLLAGLKPFVQGARRLLRRRQGDGKRFGAAGGQERSAYGVRSAGEAFGRSASASSVMTKLAEHRGLRIWGRQVVSRQTMGAPRWCARIPGSIQEVFGGSIIARAIRSRGS